jgi:hypothetical protein
MAQPAQCQSELALACHPCTLLILILRLIRLTDDIFLMVQGSAGASEPRVGRTAAGAQRRDNGHPAHLCDQVRKFPHRLFFATTLLFCEQGGPERS